MMDQKTMEIRMKRLNLMSLGFVITFGLAGGIARAGWTPPASSVTPPAVVTVHPFAAPDGNGTSPNGPLVVGPDGALYGSIYYDGIRSHGTLFRVTTDRTFTKLHDFNGTEGSGPSALVWGPVGALYGSAAEGGPVRGGVLYRLQNVRQGRASGHFCVLTDCPLLQPEGRAPSHDGIGRMDRYPSPAQCPLGYGAVKPYDAA
jgi:uncharacterized repeat protein (TIGR03803 family)